MKSELLISLLMYIFGPQKLSSVYSINKGVDLAVPISWVGTVCLYFQTEHCPPNTTVFILKFKKIEWKDWCYSNYCERSWNYVLLEYVLHCSEESLRSPLKSHYINFRLSLHELFPKKKLLKKSQKGYSVIFLDGIR